MSAITKPPLREGQLLGRKCNRSHGAVVSVYQPLGQATPAATDLKHRFSAGQAQHVNHAVELRALCFFECLACRRKQPGRIGHPRIEPLLVKVVSEVVMGGDIAPAAAPAVAVESVTKLEPKARHTQRPQWLLRRLIVRCESQQAGNIRRGPLARPVRFGKPDVPIRGEAPDAAPAVDSQSRL
jgi:hypothetical protein